MTRAQALACIPVRNQVISWETTDSGCVRIEYALVLNPLLHSIFKRLSPAEEGAPSRKIELDRLGTSVWMMLDGSNTTADIIGRFAEEHGVSAAEAEQSVTAFLRMLGKRGLIGFR